MTTALESALDAKPVLTISGAGKTYVTAKGDEVPALEPVDTVIREGEFVSLIGPSGCGKTTLLKMCAGLISTTGGSITFRDTNSQIKPGQFGMVFQSPALLPWRSLVANVTLPAEILGRPKAKMRKRAQELLELVQLKGRETRYPGELSGGMQQRVGIARSLIDDPEVLFMDEPFGALDAMTREDLNMQLQDIHMKQQTTVMFVTHSIHEAALLSDRVLVFSDGPGRILADVKIDLPRPRTIETMTSNAFVEVENRLRRLLTGRDELGVEQ